MPRALILALALLTVALPARAWAPDGEALKTLARGEAYARVDPTPGGGLIRAAVDIPLPARKVWEVMNDCQVTARLITNLLSCRTLETGPDHAWEIREQVTRGNFFVPKLRNVMRLDYEPYSRIQFRKAGGDLSFVEGEWRLEPLAGGAGTRVIYVNRMGVSIAAPAALVRSALRRDTARALSNLRRESLAAEG